MTLPYSRYVSEEMLRLFSPQTKYTLWRELWTKLALCQKRLGLEIPDQAIKEMEEKSQTVDLERAKQFEKEFKHEVMAHIAAFREECPAAAGYLHLGATSAFVMDNGDLLLMKRALKLIMHRLAALLTFGANLASENASLPCLAYTHYQSASPTTVGKRIALWLQDLLMDLHSIEEAYENLAFLGAKGATGTQSATLALFNGNSEKAKALDDNIAAEMGFKRVCKISSQTYSRKEDERVFSALTALASTAHKIGTDLRLLAHDGEFLEGFDERQIGSSAMPHKRNPVRAERVCSLARLLISLNQNGPLNHGLQWLERSLDDSANRRLVIPQMFFLADSILNLLYFLFANLTINVSTINRRLESEMPFIALESILIASVKKGNDRETIHHLLREKCKSALHTDTPLFDLITSDPQIGLSSEEIDELIKIDNFVGRAAEQTIEFIEEDLKPKISAYTSDELTFSLVEL